VSLIIDQFKRSKRYQRAAAAEKIVADVGTLRRWDLDAEARRAKFGRYCGGAAAAALVCFILSFVLPGFVMVTAPLALIFVSLALVAGVKYFAAKKQDVENRRYELVSKILSLVGADIDPDAAVTVQLDLSPTEQSSKLESKGERGRWKVKYYVDPWLSVEGRFLDGTRFRLALTEYFQRRTRWAQSRSGKMKRKSKSKTATRATLQLKVKPSKYPGLDKVAGSAQGAVQLPEQATLRGVSGDATGLVLKAGMPLGWTAPPPGEPDQDHGGARTVAMMFMSLYQVLNLTKAASKRSTV